LADAIEARRSDPGTPHVFKADERIEALKRHVEATEIVMERSLAALSERLHEHCDGWADSLQREPSEQRQLWQAALDSLTEAVEQIAAIRALIDFTTRGRFYKPVPLTPFVGRSEAGVSEALSVLREFAPSPALATESVDEAVA
jgi:hypothetical protein